MKLQHVAVVFILIFIPIILVTSYFISLQVQTIRLETSYDDKLLKSTHDAMIAFELNTANEDLSTVSDSLRSIIDASNNIFFNTLCTNFGVSNASKSYMQAYIPAILYTLYDGYYIYSPTNIPEICVDSHGQTIRTSDYGVKFNSTKTSSLGLGIGIYEFNESAINYDPNNPLVPKAENPLNDNDYIVKYDELSYKNYRQEYGQILYKNNDGTYSTELHTIEGNRDQSTYYKRDYILKSYIPYSARYTGNNAGITGDQDYDITINYTLDNFMTVQGKVGNTYYTKSGYLTDENLIKVFVNGTEATSWKDYSEEYLDECIHNPGGSRIEVVLSDGVRISNQDGYVKYNSDPSNPSSGYETAWWDDAQSAVEYYVDSYIFSNWFYENFSGVKESNLVVQEYSVSDIEKLMDDGNQTNLAKDMLYKFEDSNLTPFATVGNDPEIGDSPFYEHKRNVIKNSITYNLILSMVVYTDQSRTVGFNMPVFNETEWDMILNNISIVSFMEGLNCGLKYYNNYAIVTSTNNEFTVTDNEIYYVPRTVEEYNHDGTTSYYLTTIDDDLIFETCHRIDCDDLKLNEASNFYTDVDSGSKYWLGCISFKSKEIKYDKIQNKDGSYTYDHKVYTDYDCIVDSNYTVTNEDGTKEDGNTDVLSFLLKNSSSVDDFSRENDHDSKLTAYRIAIAKERNNLYKTTAFPENYGFQVVDLLKSDGAPDSRYKVNGSRLIESSVFNDLTKKKINEIKKIEITIENASNGTPGVYTDNVSLQLNGNSYCDSQTIATTSKNRRTLEFVMDPKLPDTDLSNIQISASSGTIFDVESIKIYYK